MGSTIAAQAITKLYTSGDEQVSVLDNLDFAIEGGGTAAVTGPSGSGKSTLLNILGAIDTADSGNVEIGGVSLHGMSEKELATFRSRKVGFVFQSHHLLPQCTVSENIRIPSLIFGSEERDVARLRCAKLMKATGMHGKEHRFPGELSGGERLRVAVARALINMPGVILADEPTGSLDADTAEMVTDVLMELSASEKTTLIVVTHSAALASRLGITYELRHGRLMS